MSPHNFNCGPTNQKFEWIPIEMTAKILIKKNKKNKACNQSHFAAN